MKNGSLISLGRPRHDHKIFREISAPFLVMIISAMIIAYFFGISIVQQTLALGNMTGGIITRPNMTNATNGTTAAGTTSGGSAGDDEAAGNEGNGG